MTAGEGFSTARQAFKAAVAARSGETRTSSRRLAERSLTLALAGQSLIDSVGSSLADATGEGAAPGAAVASVELWDCAATGIPRPPVPATAEWVGEGQGWRASTYGNGRYLCEERANYLLWLDRLEGHLVGCFTDSSELSCTEKARPLQRVMGELCRALGIQEIHAGLVASEERGVLLVGRSGRGKSTASLDGLHEGLDFLGDDSVAIGEDQAGQMWGYRLYASARILPRQLARWPRFAGTWQEPDPSELKHLLLPGRVMPERLGREARIVAVAVPAVTGRGLRVARTSPQEAFHALAHESRTNRRSGLTAREFRRLAALTRNLPCYRFEVDDDPARVAAGLRHLIDGAAP